MTERPNIRRMQMPDRDSQEVCAFDPKKEIMAADWQAIDRIQTNYRDRQAARYFQIAEQMNTLGGSADLSLEETHFEALRVFTNSPRSDTKYRFVAVAILLGLATSDEVAYLRKQALNDLRVPDVANDWQVQLPILTVLHILDGPSAPKLSEQDEKGMQEFVALLPNDTDIFFQIMADARLCGMVIPEISSDRWAAMRKRFRVLINTNHFESGFELGRNLAIVAAADIHVTPQGIKLLNSKNSENSDKIPPTPKALEL